MHWSCYEAVAIPQLENDHAISWLRFKMMAVLCFSLPFQQEAMPLPYTIPSVNIDTLWSMLQAWLTVCDDSSTRCWCYMMASLWLAETWLIACNNYYWRYNISNIHVQTHSQSKLCVGCRLRFPRELWLTTTSLYHQRRKCGWRRSTPNWHAPSMPLTMSSRKISFRSWKTQGPTTTTLRLCAPIQVCCWYLLHICSWRFCHFEWRPLCMSSDLTNR